MAKPPPPSSLASSRRMRATRSRDTEPELRLRRELHRRGMRYRVDYPVLSRRRADVAFPKARLAVFVDGCFWHGCAEHQTRSKSNTDYWDQKIAENQCRDRDTDRRLGEAGWMSIRVWEHEPVSDAADRIEEARRSRAS
ncbi:MAG: DNA mismatch endonuclease Vsr [bacterium]|nr:DNA mismatch endonuclease Vsr [bacterium]